MLRNDPNFLKWLNKFLAEIKKDGRYDKIYKSGSKVRIGLDMFDKLG